MVRSGWVLGVALVLFIRSARGQAILPDDIIGDSNEQETDILGPPLSSNDLKHSLRSWEEDLMDGEGTDDPLTSPLSELIEGDIMLSTQKELDQMMQGDPSGQLNANRHEELRWHNGVIPYIISDKFTSKEGKVIRRAMAELSDNTCIRFLEKTNSYTDYINIRKTGGCSSFVGRVGGGQKLTLGNGCVYKGIVIHELMHAIGFPHEQSRTDRDDFVTVKWGNIVNGRFGNFQKSQAAMKTELNLQYDYNSIMHYGRRAFTRSSHLNTILPKHQGAKIGQRNGLSKLDIKGINLVYGSTCKDLVPKTNVHVGLNCRDEHDNCPVWGNSGFCTNSRYKNYMTANCKKSCGLCGQASPDGDVILITAENGGPWGSWGSIEYCPSGSYVNGFKLKVEKSQGWGDDTTLNGVELFCHSASTNDYTDSISSTVQEWGTWQGKQECLKTYTVGMILRVQRPFSGDATAANNLAMKCKDGKKLWGSGGSWGTWGRWAECLEGFAICGLQTRVQADQGLGDDTALNDVKMACCRV